MGLKSGGYKIKDEREENYRYKTCQYQFFKGGEILLRQLLLP